MSPAPADPSGPGLPRHERAAAGLGLFVGVLAFGLGGLIGRCYPPESANKFHPPDHLNDFLIGLAVGAAGGFVVRHPYRASGIAPLAALVLCLGTTFSLVSGVWPGWPTGLAVGALVVSTGRVLRTLAPETFRAAIGLGAGGAGLAVWTAFALNPTRANLLTWSGWALFGLSVPLVPVLARYLARPLVELGIGALVNRNYRICGAGPGIEAFPTTGPVLVIANHASYLDPAFLGTVLPRPVTAMMTATFFDKPFIRQLMVHVFDTIRVSEDPIKRDASELREAIAALRDGKCLLIFPEGYLRRKDDVPLKRFGRGVWEVLKAHPDTPVVACWIEGAWGSYYSFKDGPPGENKVLSGRRPIGVGVSSPVPVPASVLSDHLTTRLHLMNLVLAARAHLGLEELPPVELPKRGATAGDAA